MKEHNFTVDFLGKTIPCFYIKTTENAERAIARLMEYDCLMGLDTETAALPEFKEYSQAALSPHLSQVRLLQIYNGKSSIVFDMLHLSPSIFKEFLQTKRFIGHNSLFDTQFLIKQFGVKCLNIGCTYVLWKCIVHATRPTDAGINSGLNDLCDKLLGFPILKVLQVSDWSIPDLTFEQLQYAALDAIAVWHLAEKLAPSLEKLGLTKYYKLCKAAQWPVAFLQLNGIKLDEKAHRTLIDKWRYELYASKKELIAITGLEKITGFTIATYLETHLNKDILALWPRTEENKLQTDAWTLAEFGSDNPIVKPFAIFQKKETLCSTFGSKLISRINPSTGRLCGQYKLVGCRTGRLSSNQPNLQNLPRDKDVRKDFIASQAMSFVVSDFSQIELRVAAELSRDTEMLKAFRSGIDIHVATAAKISGKSVKAVTTEERQHSKSLGFGLLFGLGAQKYARYAKHNYGVELTDTQAKESVKAWRDIYAGYRAWQLEQIESSQRTLYATTVTGKLRCLDPDYTYGTSTNQPIQGAASEVLLSALIHAQKFIETKLPSSKLVLTVHDEIVLEVKDEDVITAKAGLVSCMTQGYLDIFPNGISKNICSIGSGKNWGDAK